MKCPECKATIDSDSSFCDQCQAEIPPPVEVPRSNLVPYLTCGKKISPNAEACPACGEPSKPMLKKKALQVRAERQRMGAGIMGIVLCLMLFSPVIGGAAFLIGAMVLIIGLSS